MPARRSPTVDGLKLDERGVQRAWTDILHQTHRRGELFDLMFHPESFEHCGPALEAVLREARYLEPGVWITQLRDVNQWWREKSTFAVDTIYVPVGRRTTLDPKRVEEIAHSMLTDGQKTPILVRPDGARNG